VSILAAEQIAVARYGSAPGAAKFLEPFVESGDGRSGSPVVAGALAHLDCELSEAVQLADHTVLFGCVRAALASRAGMPLLYTAVLTGRSPIPSGIPTDWKERHMSLELTARTERGRHLVALAETLADEISPRAAAHDRDASFPFESFTAVRASGYFTAPIPEELGGLGVTSVHDVLVASSRLARGDAALTLGVNMHLAYLLNVVRRWQIAVASADKQRMEGFAETLEQIARDGTVFASAGSELRQDLTRPATTATSTEQGWTVSGHKVFCTMSPSADVLYTAVTYIDSTGHERYGYAMIPRETAGVVVHNDWDALGMRASGSHSVSFENVRLPLSALRGGFPVGDTVAYMERHLGAGLFHAAAALGIAESTHASISLQLGRRHDLDARTQVLAAETLVDLSACRAIFSRAAALIDEHHALNPTSTGTPDGLTSLFAETQTAKAFIGEAAVRIVDRALALSGGAGYHNGSPLARAYRDVRATAFMHPLARLSGCVADRVSQSLVGRAIAGWGGV
jgi:alkylation response protein AidB-like acyl-CoA dehydrogenase